MARSRDLASRTNRLLVAGVVVVLMSAALAAWAQNTRTADPSETTTEVPEVTAPSDTTGRRPAETGYSWFDHGFASEQFDFDMSTLSCSQLSTTITPDLCAVARTSTGSFMMVGTEGFWDPTEVDSDGMIWVPFDLTAYVLRTDGEGTRAVSVLDGFTQKAFTDVAVTLDMYTALVDGDEVIVLHQHLTDPDQDAFNFRESVQVVAMSPTGAPTVVATYEGYQLQVAATGTSIEMSSLRYRTSEADASDPFFTRVSLFPSRAGSNDFQWNEVATSSRNDVPNGQNMSREMRYDFPTVSNGLSNF
jgi:hypothetical protein